jgi:hypothetical protein
LPDEEDSAGDRPSHDDGLVHGGAPLAARQRPKVAAQRAHGQPKSTEAIR